MSSMAPCLQICGLQGICPAGTPQSTVRLSSTHSSPVATPDMCDAGSFQGNGSGYPRPVPRTAAEREESRKAARLALDTSAHSGQEYEAVLRSLTPPLRGNQVGLLAACSLCTPLA